MLELLSQITFEMYMYYLGYTLISVAIGNLFGCLNEIDAESYIIKAIIYSLVGIFLIFYFKSKI